MLHDENVYMNPNDFNPDRYTTNKLISTCEPDPARAAFGFGRRICPGRFFVDDSLWFTIVSTLQVFKITKPADAPIVDVVWSSGLVRCV